MTALETIIESELPARRGTIISKAAFKPLRQKLEALIAADGSLTTEARDIFLNKVAALNQKVFALKIDALFDHYKISRSDFEGDVIRRLVALRNGIVHTGTVANDHEIWTSIILVRELITRILLKEIGFIGRYCCYVGGLNYREFLGEIGPV